MSMPEFIGNIEKGSNQPGWLTPATVADLSESDFSTMPARQRQALFDAVERFKTIAETDAISPEQETQARTALDGIRDILRPYLSEESLKIREAIWRAWRDDGAAAWIPTFDYALDEDWAGNPAVWVWLILNDDVDVEEPATRAGLNSLRTRIRKELYEAGIERRPYINVRSQAEVRELMAGASR